MATIILQNGPMTAPEQLKEWVVAHPVRNRRYLCQEYLKIRLADLADEWQEAAYATHIPDVIEFTRLILEDFTQILDNTQED